MFTQVELVNGKSMELGNKKRETMRRPYKKHFVLINKKHIPVKDWYRDNSQLFEKQKGIPTSEQIGTVLRGLGFERIESETEVIYSK
jgi:hypothetical protein